MIIVCVSGTGFSLGKIGRQVGGRLGWKGGVWLGSTKRLEYGFNRKYFIND